jgi:type I restriction enzyme S subunit
MNKIEELIAQHCPNGVKFKTLGDTCVIKTGKGITKNDGSDTALYPIISGGKEPMGYYHNFNRLENTITISRVGANAGYVSFINTKFYLNDKCFSIVPKEEYECQINTKFIFYFLKENEYCITGLQSEGGVPTINTTKISKLFIPIPPLPIQKEIVNILDKFKALEAELEAELEARKKQYEFYRNKLLSFSDLIICGGGG